MKELFVPYEESLALRELGFNELCAAYWHNSGYLEIGEVKNQSYLLAPIWDQAFEWFKKKHNLPSYIRPIWQTELNAFSYQWHIVENKEDWNGVEHFKTYKEAQIVCLQKMIEQVKSNS